MAKPGTPREVRACMRCGSDDLGMAGLRDGVMVGEAQDLAKWACKACGLAAVPLLFDDEASRVAFAAARSRERAKERGEPWPPSGWPSVGRDGR